MFLEFILIHAGQQSNIPKRSASCLLKEQHNSDEKEGRNTFDMKLSSSVTNSAKCRPGIRANSLELNGFKIRCVKFRYYISEINEEVLRQHFADNHIQIGDEVIKVNNEYCEHLRNVTKYIETTSVHCIHLRHVRTGEYYTETETIVTSIPMAAQSTSVNSKGRCM